MLMLWDWHPDIEEFITVKQDLSKINGANLSVCVSDAFMEAVKADKDWDLVYPDIADKDYDAKWNGEIDEWKKLGKKVVVYKTVKAKELWDLICTAAWQSAEPGLHFMERSNKRSNTHYFERLVATNPCLTGDSWVHTIHGPQQIKDLIGKQFVAKVNGEEYLSGSKGFFQTGTKDVIKLQTKEGYSLRLTTNHLIKKVTHKTRYALTSEWVEAGKLIPGDSIVLNDHRKSAEWKGQYTFDEGYLMGLLLGDGTIKVDKAILSVWQSRQKQFEKEGPRAVMQQVLQVTQQMPHRSDFAGWTNIADRREYRLSLKAIKDLAEELGIYAGNKKLTSAVEKASSNFCRGLLRGFFDTDGSVQGSQSKGVSVRLAQSDEVSLETAQRMLLRLGIASQLYKNRRAAGSKLLPNGRGGRSVYKIKAQHELVISGENLLRFAATIGFSDTDKERKLNDLLGGYKRVLNKENFLATVDIVTNDGIEDVFDVQIPGVNAFDANGLYVHNCGEQPLGPWAVCNLGAMNLSAYVKGDDLSKDKAGEFDYENFRKDVKVAMRMLDNVIDQTYYFFKENEKCAKDIRRTGLGIMGLGDALIKMQLGYGSEASLPVLHKIFATLRDSAYEASVDIAKEKGAFPKFNKVKYLQGYHIQNLPKKIQQGISTYGIRNAVLLTIAPTGTTSLVSGVSSGVEPVYEFSFKRTWRGGEEIMYHPLFEDWKKAHPDEKRPSYFVSANDLTPMEHVKVQAVAQEYIDSSISKTVNAPNSHTVEDVKTLYMAAYDYGLKGVTYMRDGSRQGVLERLPEKKEIVEAPIVVQQPALPIMPVIVRPQKVEGTTYRAETPVGETFITINHIPDTKEPFEVFVTIGKSGSDVGAMAEALGRLISLNLRLNGMLAPRERVRQIVAQLTGIGGARSVGFGINKVRSLPDAIAKVLSQHFGFAVNGKVEDKKVIEEVVTNGVIPGEIHAETASAPLTHAPHAEQLSLTPSSNTSLFDICPECGTGSFAYEEGCKKCYSCGYSEC